MKTVKLIIKVIYNIVFVLLIVSSLFVILTSYDIIKGYNFYVVMSGSMEPTIHTGSIITVTEQETYNKDDIITVKMKNDPNQTYTHRIVEVTQEGYQTKGDANESADPDIATEELVIGKTVLNIPILGYLAHFAKQPTGFIIMIIIPCIIIIASEINNIKEFVKEKLEEKKESKLKKDSKNED
jgi:signal peptidase